MSCVRGVVGTLGGFAAAFAATVGAVSLWRIAGDYLGFPDGLEWTLPAAVDVAGIAGGIMWTGFIGRIRNIGRLMNIVCTVVSGIGVGLDHATHAPTQWRWVAFAIGMFMPLLVAWILHALAVMADQTATQADDTDRDTETPAATRREAAPRPPDREAETPAAGTGSVLVATTATPHREAITASADAGPLPHVSVDVAPALQRPGWAPPELVEAVEASIRATDGGRRNYGVPSLQRDHKLPDGKPIGSHRATALLAHVDARMGVAA